jgi:DNA-binding transcriptional MocR family regulator
VRGSGSTLALPGGHRGSAGGELSLPLDFTKATSPAYPGLAAAFARAAERIPAHLSMDGFDMVGLPELRRSIAGHYEGRGLPTSPDQIMVTTGAQHALSLITHALHSAGERVLVEHPTYPHALDTFAAAGARIVTVPVAAGPGWNLPQAQLLLRRSAPSLAFVMPDFHNPTGLSMPEEARAALARMAQREGTTLIVDETTAWLDIDRGPRSPMAVHSSAIVTLGSLGKVAWGGLRIGWIRASRELLDRVLQIRPGLDLGTPLLEQLVAVEVLAEARELQSSRSAQLRRGRDQLVDAVRSRFPQWSLDVPDGGLALWVNTGNLSTSALALAARAEGLALVPGPRFGTDGAFERFLRLPFGYPPEQLTAAVEVLARVAPRAGTAPLKTPLQAVI